MSNYIFNDSLGVSKNQASCSALKKKAQLPIVLIVCTALIATSMIILTCVLAFGAFSHLFDKSGTPRVTNNTSYVSNNEQVTLSEEKNGTDALGALQSSVVSISTKTGASGSGVIAGEFSDSNGKHGYYIVTCTSVIGNLRSGLPALISEVTLENGDKYEALLCGADSSTGIAVLKIYENEKKLSCAKWASPDAPQPSGFVVIGGQGGGVFNLNGELVGIGIEEQAEKINFIPGAIAFEAYERLTESQYQRKLN